MNTSPNRSAFLILSFLASSASLCAQVGAPVPNWTVPQYTRQSLPGTLSTMADATGPAPFVAVTPCRVVDTRGPVGPYGGPALAANVTRAFNIEIGPCTGLPPAPSAYSLNFGGILPPADGFLTAWPAGTAQPTVSQLNLIGGEVVANAAIVPAGALGGGSTNVRVNVGPTHIYIDINGYFVNDGFLNPNESFNLFGSTVDCLLCLQNSNNSPYRVINASMTSAQPGAAVINAQNFSDTGANYGVAGSVASITDNSAGVFGREGGSFVLGTHVTAGVRGESQTGGTGVLGLVGDSTGEGVTGIMVNGSGAFLSAGHLGFSATIGVFFENGLAGTGTKSFVEPHPTDPSKVVQYVSLEGNEAGTYFRGRGRFQNGIARIRVPEDFRIVTDPEGLTVQITPIGGMASVGVLRIGLDEIVAQSSRDLEFSYMVNGVRRAYPHVEPIAENAKFFVPASPDATIPQYLSPDEKRRLIENGTYRPDGKVNLETARRLGWDKNWEKRSRPAPEPTP
jgi:hypothetical protein